MRKSKLHNVLYSNDILKFYMHFMFHMQCPLSLVCQNLKPFLFIYILCQTFNLYTCVCVMKNYIIFRYILDFLFIYIAFLNLFSNNTFENFIAANHLKSLMIVYKPRNINHLQPTNKSVLFIHVF